MKRTAHCNLCNKSTRIKRIVKEKHIEKNYYTMVVFSYLCNICGTNTNGEVAEVYFKKGK